RTATDLGEEATAADVARNGQRGAADVEDVRADERYGAENAVVTTVVDDRGGVAQDQVLVQRRLEVEELEARVRADGQRARRIAKSSRSDFEAECAADHINVTERGIDQRVDEGEL